MKKALILVFSIIFLSISGCKKKSTTDPQIYTCLPSKYIAHDISSDFYYDVNHRIIKTIGIMEGDTLTSEYVYENDKLVFEVITPASIFDTIFYEYSLDGMCSKMSNNTSPHYYLFSYNSQKLVDTISFYDENRKFLISVYEYNSEGNAIEYKEFFVDINGSLSPGTTASFEYGQNINWCRTAGPPYSPTLRPSYCPFLSKNNVIKATYNYQLGPIILIYTYASFNENGYPNQCTVQTEQGQIVGMETYYYNCF